MQLNGAGSCTLALINGMCHIVLTDISFISGIINDYGANFIGIVHPFLQLILCKRCSGRVIRQTQIDYVRCLLRKLRYEMIFCCTWHVNDIAPCAGLLVVSTGSSSHNVGIHINRIDRITDRNLVVLSENLLNISGIALCSVRYKDFICCNLTASCCIIVLCDCLAQKFISQIRCIAMECLGMSHLIYRFMHSLNDCRSQWLCNITDSQTDNVLVRICLLICIYFFCNCAE